MEFMPCPYFLMYDSEAMLPPLNENPTHIWDIYQDTHQEALLFMIIVQRACVFSK